MIIKIDSNDAIAHFYLALIMKDQASNKTVDVVQKNKLLQNAILHYNEAIKINPKDADAHYNLALIYHNNIKGSSVNQSIYK